MSFNTVYRILAAATAATLLGVMLFPRRRVEAHAAQPSEVDRWEGEGGNVPSIPPPYVGPEPSDIPAPDQPI